MCKPKKVTSWRVCPNCSSRVTKMWNLDTGLYHCQICKHEYADPEEKRLKETSKNDNH